MRFVRSFAVVAAVMTVIVPAALARGYHSAPPASAEDVQVVIESFAFQPDSVTVSPGTTVTWVNLDPWIHTVTSDTGAFDSGDLDPNESYSHTFDSIGHYWYHCSRHTSMHGVVIVASETLYDQSDYLGSQASISTDWDDPQMSPTMPRPPGPPPPPPPVVSPEYPVSDPGGGSQSAPSLAFDGTNYLAAWEESATVLSGRVDQFGNHLDGPGTQIGDGFSDAVAFDGANYLVAWDNIESRGWPIIRGARVGTDGVVLDPSGFTIRNGGMYWWATNPDVAFNGTNYLVVWREQDDTAHQWVYVRGVSPSGEVLDLHTLSYPDYPSNPSVGGGEHDVTRRLEYQQRCLRPPGRRRRHSARERVPAGSGRVHAARRLRRDELPRHVVGRGHPREACRRGRHGARRDRNPDLNRLG